MIESPIPFEKLFEVSLDGMFVARPDGSILRANPAACRALGRTEEEICRMGREGLVVLDDRVRALIVQRDTAGSASGELVFRRKDGSTFTAEFTSGTFRDAAGPLAYTVFRDVSERQRVEAALLQREEALRESLLRFQLASRATSNLIWDWDLRTDALWWNENVTPLFGYRAEELEPGIESWTSRIHPEDAERVERGIHAVIDSDEIHWTDEYRFRRADGSWAAIADRGYVRRDATGCPLRMIGAMEDVSGRRRAEADRDHLTTAIEQAAEVVVITDTRGDIVYVNPAFEQVTGWSRAEALGQNPRILKSGVQEPAFYRSLWETIAAGNTWRGRLVNRRKDGSLFTEDATISPVRDAAGTIVSFVAVKRDITRLLTVEAQLLQSQKMESIGRLAGGVAHDFNNIVAVILGSAGFALQAVKAEGTLRDDLIQIEQAARRAASLTRQLLAFSRKQVLQPVPLDLNRVLSDMEKMLRRVIGEDVGLELELAGDLGVVTADPGQIEQVVLNLAINARDAMPEGGRLTITTRTVAVDAAGAALQEGVEPGDYAEVAVADSGIGMDADTLARVFEPFFTTKGVGKGTGLGLSTVYGIIKQSGGFVSVESEPGHGATFRLFLPVRPALPLAPTEETLERVRAVGAETVLVVEDDHSMRELTRRILALAGYTVLTAANGADALAFFESGSPEISLVVTDVVMPEMGGRPLARRLAKLRPGLKVLYMSGYTDEAIAHHGILEPGMQFINKPFGQSEFLHKVRAVLDQGKE